MSQENVEVVRRMHEAVGTEAALDYFDSEVVVINSPKSPDTAPYVGHAGLVAWVRDVRAALGDFRAEAEETIDIDDKRVLVVAAVRGDGRASGLPVDVVVPTVYTLRDRKIVKAQAYDTKAQALEAVGLDQP